MTTKAKTRIYDHCVIKEHHDPVRFERELRGYTDLPWAAPVLIDHGANWLRIERITPIMNIPRSRSKVYRKPLWDLLQRVHDAGWWHGDPCLVNVVVCPDRGPLLIDWESLTPSRGDKSYDLYGALECGFVQDHPPEGRGTGIYWGGPWLRCPGRWW